MFRTNVCVCAFFLLAYCVLPVNAQQPAAASANLAVPPMVNFSGVLNDVNGKPLTGTVGVTFYLYKDSEGGAPLWMETQNVQVDKAGHYTAALGAASSQGLPPAMFASGEARWLGVHPQGQAEQPRVLLMSVPYALKALDAETIGGRPVSSFMLAPTSSEGSGKGNAPPGTITGHGTADFVPMFTGTTTIANSIIFQTVGGNVGIGTTTPSVKLDVKGKENVRDTLALFPNTTHPVLSVHGTALSVDHTGLVTFVSGQTFPGTGTVTSVGLSAPASDFTVSGSPVTHSGTLGLAWTVNPTSSNTANAIVKRDGSGSFSASTISAGSLFGNGAGVTNVNAAALGGLAPGAFAQLAAANTFTASQTIAGNMNVSGSGNGVTFPDGTKQQTAALFATVANSGLVFAGSGVTNVLQLNITVPTSGFLFASADGYCNTNTTSSLVQWAYVIATSASQGWAFPDPLVLFPSGSNVAQFPITAQNVFSVSAGVNSIFLNVDNLSGTPLSSCGARLTGFFTPAHL